MPVMVVGADTERGRRIAERFLDPHREVRAFVTDPDTAEELRQSGAKVALGDVSDDSHLAGACLNCFSVVLVTDAARDQRQRAFAPTPDDVLQSWAKAVSSASVARVIWVMADDETPSLAVDEVAVVDRDDPDLVETVFRLDEARTI
jgi:putative NADH-flavin reductase